MPINSTQIVDRILMIKYNGMLGVFLVRFLNPYEQQSESRNSVYAILK